MNYSIKAILPPWVFVEDQEGKMDRIPFADFTNNPKLNAAATKNEDGTWTTNGNNTDPDCVGGVCPIR